MGSPLCCVPAVLRLFFHLSGAVFGPAGAFAVVFLCRGEFESASISAGISAAALVYWMAFYARKDLR